MFFKKFLIIFTYVKFINKTVIQKSYDSITSLPGQAPMTQRTVVVLFPCFAYVIFI